MRYRILSPTGDYVFGVTGSEFLVNSPACVAQAILTSLRLFQGEWFLDSTQGVPWLQKVIGLNAKSIYDQAIRSAILGVSGVKLITFYASVLSSGRSLTITATVNTIYGSVTITTPITLPIGFGMGGS